MQNLMRRLLKYHLDGQKCNDLSKTIANIEIGIFLAFQSIETTQKQRECIVLNFKHL